MDWKSEPAPKITGLFLRNATDRCRCLLHRRCLASIVLALCCLSYVHAQQDPAAGALPPNRGVTSAQSDKTGLPGQPPNSHANPSPTAPSGADNHDASQLKTQSTTQAQQAPSPTPIRWTTALLGLTIILVCVLSTMIKLKAIRKWSDTEARFVMIGIVMYGTVLVLVFVPNGDNPAPIFGVLAAVAGYVVSRDWTTEKDLEEGEGVA
jgi:hypothetical protein